MLDVMCATCGRTLIGLRQIVSLTTTDEGIRVTYVCSCGRPGAETTGRGRRAGQAPVVPSHRPLTATR